MQREVLHLRDHYVSVAREGSGPPLLLVHGGWAGAEMHWSRVWPLLAPNHELIAPDLPGLGVVDEEPLASVSDYADWLVELLDAFEIECVAVVGNSFGASVAWSMAGLSPHRCSALVLVDGFPMPRTPAPLRWLSRVPGTRRLFSALIARLIYSEGRLPQAFYNEENVPVELRRAMHDDWPLIVPRYVDILVAGDGGPAPELRPLLLWGERDRLPGSSSRDARRWHGRLQGSTLQMVPGAGHFPQVEAPEIFAEAIDAFLAAEVERRHERRGAAAH